MCSSLNVCVFSPKSYAIHECFHRIKYALIKTNRLNLTITSKFTTSGMIICFIIRCFEADINVIRYKKKEERKRINHKSIWYLSRNDKYY